MRRRAVALGLLTLVAAGLVLGHPAPSAASTDTSITTNVAIGGVREVGGSWASNADCGAGTISGFEYSCAFEFNISSISSDAKVTSATLAIHRTTGCPTNDCTVDLAVYTGDGSATLGDMSLGSNVASFTPGSSTKYFNVAGHVQSRTTNGDDWIGYRISTGASASNTTPQAFDMTGANRVTLAVSYVENAVDVQVYFTGVGAGGFGKVTSNPAGIDCGLKCLWWFSYAEPVTLTAVPESTATFGYWQGGPCNQSHNPVCTFDVPALSVETNAIFYGNDDGSTMLPPPTPTATPKHTTPVPTSRASSGPVVTQAPVDTTAPTDVIASDGTIITPGPTAIVNPSGPPPTIVGIDDNAGDAGASGGIGLPIVILLIVVLGGIVGGGVYWYTKRQQAPGP